MSYTPQCAWTCWVDAVELSSTELALLTRNSQSCALWFEGGSLASGSNIGCVACIVIEGSELCANNTLPPSLFHVLTPPAIRAVTVLSEHDDVFSMADSVGFNVSNSSFDDATTTYTVYAYEGNDTDARFELAVGSINDVAARNIVFGHVDVEQLIKIGVCAEDENECSSCFELFALILQNQQLHDEHALCGAIANITESVRATNNTLLRFHVARIVIGFLGDNFCEHSPCLLAAYDRGFDTVLQLIAENEREHNPQYVHAATLSMAQFVARDDCNASLSSNRSAERIRSAVEILANQVETKEDAQNVLDVGSELLAKAGGAVDGDEQAQGKERADEVSDKFCAALDFVRGITDTMLDRVVGADSGPNSTSLSGDAVCGGAVRACSNCELSLSTADCVPEISVAAHLGTTSTTQRQINVVAVDLESARFCIEREFWRRSGTNVSGDEGTVLLSELFNISFNDYGGGLGSDEEMVVTLPRSLLEQQTVGTDGCPLGELAVLFFNESSGRYSSQGIAMINGTTFSSEHNSVFVAARKIKQNKRGNALGNVVVSGFTLSLFFFIAVWLPSHDCLATLRKWRRLRRDISFSDGLRCIVLLICVVSVVAEALTIAYYAQTKNERCDDDGTSLANDLTVLFVLLPMALHFYAASICIAAWKQIYWSTTMTRSAAQITRFHKRLSAANLVFSALIGAVAVCVAVFDDDAVWRLLLLTAGVLTALLNLGVALSMSLAMCKLMRHVKNTARSVGREYDAVVVRKLYVSGVVCPICFVTYSAVLTLSVCDEALFLRYDAAFNLVAKLSHVVGLVVVLFMFSGHSKGRTVKKAPAPVNLGAYEPKQRGKWRTGRGGGRSAQRNRDPRAIAAKNEVSVVLRLAIESEEKDEVKSAPSRSQSEELSVREAESDVPREETEAEPLPIEARECAQCFESKSTVGGQWENDSWYCGGCCAQYKETRDEAAPPKESEETFEDEVEPAPQPITTRDCAQCLQSKSEVEGQWSTETEPASWYCGECCAEYDQQQSRAKAS
jgi:hypothetical protein